MKPTVTARLFVALWPDDGTRAALARCRDAWTWEAAAVPERSERFHLTLHFLGAVPLIRLPELIEGLQVSCSACMLHLDRRERWPNGIAALIPRAVPPALLELHAALRVAIERLGLPTETRRWRPHVTLARRAGESVVSATASTAAWPVSGYALVQSRAGTGEYVVLRHYM